MVLSKTGAVKFTIGNSNQNKITSKQHFLMLFYLVHSIVACFLITYFLMFKQTPILSVLATNNKDDLLQRNNNGKNILMIGN